MSLLSTRTITHKSCLLVSFTALRVSVSCIMRLTAISEQWLEALGYQGVVTDQMPAWRRAHMSNLLKAFDFDHPDYTIPDIPLATPPSEDSDGNWDSAVLCQGTYGTPPPHPPAPYGPDNENLDPATLVEDGFKSVRGYLTEGRYLVFEMNGYALTNAGKDATDFTGTRATSNHTSINQRWVVHATGGTALEGGEGSGTFFITSAVDGRYIADHTSLDNAESGAETFTITDLGNGNGYSLLKENGKYLSIETDGTIGIYSTPSGFKVYSVTYQS
jgi:phospholipase C